MTKIMYFISLLSFAAIIATSCNTNAQTNKKASSDMEMTQDAPLNWKKVIYYSDHGAPAPDRRVEKTDAEWKEILTPEQFRVTRNDGTERAFTGEHYDNYDPGIYSCICCATELFKSEQKFKSGTGWPSFTAPIKDNVIKYLSDRSYGMRRVEVECNVCDAHLGHVFNDGPEPTGLRYCINSVSLQKIDDNKNQ